MKRATIRACAVELFVAASIIAAFAIWYGRARDPAVASREHFADPQYTGIDYERLYAITTAFRRVLERPPTEDELQRFKSKLSLDPEFDVPALENALRQSAEYKRLVGLQKNSSLANVDGVVSEQAIRGKLSDMHVRITGSKPDDITMELLYSRYRHTNLSDAYITALIQQIAGEPGSKDAVEKGSGTGHVRGGDEKGGADAGGSTEFADVSDNMQRDGEETIGIERAWLRSLGLNEEQSQGTPEQVVSRLKEIAKSCREATSGESAACDKRTRCEREQKRVLDSIGYQKGESVGSWTMPQSRDVARLERERNDHRKLRASADRTMLGVSPISDSNMTLF